MQGKLDPNKLAQRIHPVGSEGAKTEKAGEEAETFLKSLEAKGGRKWERR